jgi:thioredoxin 1
LSELLREFNESNFISEVINSEIPVLVDFWAVWCGPCRLIEPGLERIAEEKKDKLKIGRLNIDENGYIASRFGINSIPALMLFKGGKAVKMLVGALPKNMILNEISQFL